MRDRSDAYWTIHEIAKSGASPADMADALRTAARSMETDAAMVLRLAADQTDRGVVFDWNQTSIPERSGGTDRLT